MAPSQRPQRALGQAIRQIRESRGLIERGQSNPTWATVTDIAAALGVPASEMVKVAERLRQTGP